MPDVSDRGLGCLVAADRPCRKNILGQISQVSGRAPLAAPKRCDVGLMALFRSRGPNAPFRFSRRYRVGCRRLLAATARLYSETCPSVETRDLVGAFAIVAATLLREIESGREFIGQAPIQERSG